MKISDEGLAFILDFEKFRSRPYHDSAGVLTIGYGRTHGVSEGDVTTEPVERQWTAEYCDKIGRQILQSVKVPLEQHQFDVLVSFVYNVGIGRKATATREGEGFRGSTLLRRLNAGAYDDVPAQLARWNKSGGRVINGLKRRRAAEADIWIGDGDETDDLTAGLDEPSLKPIAQSKTMGGAVPSIVGGATAAGGVISALGSLSPIAQAIIGGGLVLAMAGAAFVVWNRWQERKRGER